MTDAMPPPPRREARSVPHSRTNTPEPGWKQRWSAKGKLWGGKAFDKSIGISDKIGTKVNYVVENKIGSEAFYPVSNDFPQECEKAARILRAFTGESDEPNPQQPRRARLRQTFGARAA